MKSQKAVFLAERQTRGRVDEDANLFGATPVDVGSPERGRTF
jgi:hypothetical protein